MYKNLYQMASLWIRMIRTVDFWASRIRIRIRHYLYGSGSFSHQAKIVRKNPWFLILCVFFITFHLWRLTKMYLKKVKRILKAVLRIQIRDPMPFWPLDPGSGIRNGFFPDPGTIFWRAFWQIFLVKSSIILWKLAQIFFFSTSKLK